MIEKINFPAILPDNEEHYFSFLEGVVYSIDDTASIMIIKNSEGYLFRIAPSLTKYSQSILNELLGFHKLLHIKLDLSKSIRTNGVITFKIRNL